MWEIAAYLKTGQGVSRQEREFSFLSAGFEVWGLIEASNGVIRIYGSTTRFVWEGLDVRTVGVSFDHSSGWNNWENG